MSKQLICTFMVWAAAVACVDPAVGKDDKRRPNVVFVITDDQGYGDLGFTGNPVIQTPHLDKLAGESVWLEDYHVAPSCSPTRSALLTGRWTNRTGAWHTFFARAMMYEDEVTIADHFQAAGYATGMFGKWHLGDHYPYSKHVRVRELTHMVDVLPTLLDLCGVKPCKDVALDGRSIRKLLSGEGDPSFDWESRVVVSDSQRIQYPRKWKDSSVMAGKWRLINGKELFDIRSDPGQQNNIAGEHPQRVADLRAWYEDWWAELEPTFSRTSQIYVGSAETPESRITALQWIDQAPPWNQGIIRRARQAGRSKKPGAPTRFNGHWAVNVLQAGDYVFEVCRWPEESGLKIREGVDALPVTPGCLPSYSAVRGTALPVVSATLRIDGKDLETKPVGDNDASVRFTHRLTRGDHKFSPYFSLKPVDSAASGHELGCYYLTVTLLR